MRLLRRGATTSCVVPLLLALVVVASTDNTLHYAVREEIAVGSAIADIVTDAGLHVYGVEVGALCDSCALEPVLMLQRNRLRWYGHVLREADTDWVKKCMQYETEGSRPRGRPKRKWREVVQRDCQARNWNREDAVDRSRWKKLIKVGSSG